MSNLSRLARRMLHVAVELQQAPRQSTLFVLLDEASDLLQLAGEFEASVQASELPPSLTIAKRRLQAAKELSTPKIVVASGIAASGADAAKSNDLQPADTEEDQEVEILPITAPKKPKAKTITRPNIVKESKDSLPENSGKEEHDNAIANITALVKEFRAKAEQVRDVVRTSDAALAAGTNKMEKAVGTVNSANTALNQTLAPYQSGGGGFEGVVLRLCHRVPVVGPMVLVPLVQVIVRVLMIFFVVIISLATLWLCITAPKPLERT